ncbi:MAG TPA: hypothetical protein VNZ22_15140, partial [Bacillota bacterium]|nr:hypothetical protein [Bacillota bacterium]
PARSFAVAPDGTIYASMRDHVEVFDPSGQRQAIWAPPAPRAWLSSLAVGEKEVYATDATTRIVWRFDLSGKVIGKIGQKDSSRKITGFVVPSPFFDMKLGRDGLLRVANPGQHLVETYTTTGDLEFSWGKPGTAIESFCGCCNPISIALFSDGRVVTCEKGLPRVKVYSARGQLEAVAARPEDFENAAAPANVDWSDHVTNGLDVAVDSRERIYILYWASAQVRVMTRKANT